MKITRITQQVKRANRYSVYVDDAYCFSLSESALIKSGIASGQELRSEQVDSYKQLSTEDKLYNRTLHYVAVRSRTTWEVTTYLQRKDAPPPLVTEIIERLTELGLLNDAAYAVSFVHDRQLLRPTSRRKLVLELKKRRVPEQYIQDALAEVEVDESQSLRELIVKKRRQTKYQDDTKLMQYLARQGFGYNDIKTALQAGTLVI